MVLLKEDGRLDVNRINNLPIEEYVEVIGELTDEQYQYYLSKTPICEGCQRTIVVDFLPMDEVIERGIGVDAEVLLNDLREKLKHKNEGDIS